MAKAEIYEDDMGRVCKLDLKALKSAINEYVRNEVKESGDSVAIVRKRFADSIPTSTSTVRNWLEGRNAIPKSDLDIILEKLNVNFRKILIPIEGYSYNIPSDSMMAAFCAMLCAIPIDKFSISIENSRYVNSSTRFKSQCILHYTVPSIYQNLQEHGYELNLVIKLRENWNGEKIRELFCEIYVQQHKKRLAILESNFDKCDDLLLDTLYHLNMKIKESDNALGLLKSVFPEKFNDETLHIRKLKNYVEEYCHDNHIFPQTAEE